MHITCECCMIPTAVWAYISKKYLFGHLIDYVCIILTRFKYLHFI